MRALLLQLALLLFPSLAYSHSYLAGIPELHSWGTRISGSGCSASQFSSADASVCNYLISSGSVTFHTPLSVAAFIASGVSGTHQWRPRINSPTGAEDISFTGYTRLCPSGKTWTPTGTFGTCVDPPPVCDSDHHLEITTPSPGTEVAYCVDPPERDCPGAAEWDHTLDECGDEPPPVCTPPNFYIQEFDRCGHPDCPVGQIMQSVVVVEGAPEVMMCMVELAEGEELPDQGCNFLDPTVEYALDIAVCASEKGSCDAVNGVIIVLPDNQKRCFPLQPSDPEDPDPPPREPKCPSSDFVAWNLDIGDFVCSPKSPDPKNIPDSERQKDKDTDGDGIPDKDDDDIDGDGIANGDDDDIDGDGISNGNDPKPWGGSGPGEGDGEGEGESVAGGGNCIDKPQCKGSAVECAIVYQTWKTRCEIEKLNAPGDLDGFDRDADRDYFGSSDLDDDIDDLKTEFTEKVEEFRGLVSSDLSIGGAGSLPCLGTVSYGGESTEWCLDEYADSLSNIGPAILFLSYFIAAIIVLRR